MFRLVSLASSIVAVPNVEDGETSLTMLLMLICTLIAVGFLSWLAHSYLAKETVLEPLGGPVIKTPVRLSAWFEYIDKKAKRMPITKSLIRIGRHRDNDFSLQDPFIDSHHAIVQFTNEDIFIIADLNETDDYCVYVNNMKIKRTILYDNDVIKLGNIQLRFRVKYAQVGQLSYMRSYKKKNALKKDSVQQRDKQNAA